MKLAQLFGNVRQEGYIVRDMQSAIRHWTEALGGLTRYALNRDH